MTFTTQQQNHFIRLAMAEAEKSISLAGNPFGAVLVRQDGEVLAATRDTVTPATDITLHAELNLLRRAAELYRLQKFGDCAVFMNAASCTMCAAALIQAGVRNLYYGAPIEPRTNPSLSYLQLVEYMSEPLLIKEGILLKECRAQIARGRAEQKAR